LSVIIQHQTEAKYLFKVPKNVFFPKPNVDSAVIKLTIKKEINNNEHKELYRFVHSCFSQRRKTLVNNLSQVYKSVSKEEMSQILEELGYNQMVRAESLELKDFVSLFNKLQDKQYLK
jgi:16S rRNA (adenine1518-N6/adenine1519-N6)-dimethyltransferase